MSVTRQFWVICHRWAGLTIALFLTIAGFTGIFLAFNDELEATFAPRLVAAVPPAPDARPLDPLAVRAKVMAAYPGAVIAYTPLAHEPGQALTYYVSRLDPGTGTVGEWSSDWDQLFVNPYTGAVQGTRKWGDISQGSVNLMPFVYRLHYSMALGDWGVFAFGIAALIWTIDSFVGFYLTLPVSIRRSVRTAPAGGPSWWRRWRPSWSVRRGVSAYKVSFDLHRAGGLWIWPMLLVFAWSSVAFNLSTVYAPVMTAFGAEDIREGISALAKPMPVPPMAIEGARTRGAVLAAQEMKRLGLTAGAAASLYYDASTGIYSYSFSSGRDFTNDGGRSSVLFSAIDGHLVKVWLPSGQNGARTFTNWIMALHMGMVFGLPYRIAVALIGMTVTTLSITGVIIWMKKRSGRIGRKKRLPSRGAVLQPAE